MTKKELRSLAIEILWEAIDDHVNELKNGKVMYGDIDLTKDTQDELDVLRYCLILVMRDSQESFYDKVLRALSESKWKITKFGSKKLLTENEREELQLAETKPFRVRKRPTD